mgnify:CR=1 FL=1
MRGLRKSHTKTKERLPTGTTPWWLASRMSSGTQTQLAQGTGLSVCNV